MPDRTERSATHALLRDAGWQERNVEGPRRWIHPSLADVAAVTLGDAMALQLRAQLDAALDAARGVDHGA